MKKNPFLIGYLAVTLVGAAALGFLLYLGYTKYAEVDEAYTSAVQQLISLKNRSPFPSDENNAAYDKLTEAYKVEYEKLLAKVQSMQEPVENIRPNQFADRLKAYVSEVREAAQANNVTLPDNFYLGFAPYETELPKNEAAGPLARQLSAIRLVVDQLIESKVKSIGDIKRTPLPQESGAPAPEQPSGPGSRNRPQGAQTASIVEREPFEISFSADQGRARQALNSIVRADRFLVIRALNITNSATGGPTRKAAATPGASTAQNSNAAFLNQIAAGNEAGADGSTTSSTPESNLRILVGQEVLNIGARIEVLNFNLADSSQE